MKTSKLIKRALNHPELFTEGELTYLKLMKKLRKEQKAKKKQSNPESDYLI